MKTNHKLLELAYTILSLKCLYPDDFVNSVFQRFVSAVLETKSDTFQITPCDLCKLRKRCAVAEEMLEIDWANRVRKSVSPKKSLLSFPYYDNYLSLASFEIGLIKNFKRESKIIFVGSGPLPLSGILLAKSGYEVWLMDRCPFACFLAEKLLTKLGMIKRCKVLQQDAFRFSNYSDFPIIILGALVGQDEKEKNKLLQSILSNTLKGSLILARSTWGARRIFYPVVNTEWCKPCDFIEEFRPKDPKLVNSCVACIV